MTAEPQDRAKARRRRKFLALEAAFLMLLLGGAELSLRLLAPFEVVSAGSRVAPNALRYGWGIAPGAPILVVDPDTGAPYRSFANSRGWRDTERTLEKPEGRFRVVVLGDSNTFGQIVPAESVYTRVLEDRLRSEGYDVEVINISQSGWGTDQQLEALGLEGLLYRPDLVVLQFCTNDLTNNLERTAPPLPAVKPFLYTLDDDGRARRQVNEAYVPPLEEVGSWVVERLVKRSELLKRLFFSHLAARRFEPGQAVPPAQYRHDETSDTMLRLELGERSAALRKALPTRMLRREEVDELLADMPEPQAEVCRRILEDRPSRSHWSAEAYEGGGPVDRESPRWRLFFALLREMAERCKEHGASFAVISDNESGQYTRLRAWSRIAPSPEARARLLRPTELLRSIAAEEGVGFVESGVPHQRARNDAHPNVAGNAAMAENLYRYLMREHGARLPRIR